MKIIEPSVEFVTATPNLTKVLELAGRTCYKSHDKEREGSDEKLIRHTFIAKQHESVLEHGNITLQITTDRAVLSQLTRHRHFSFSVESQRYVNYTKDKFGSEILVIKPFDITPGTDAWSIWKNACQISEGAYFSLIESGCKPEVARSVLPNSTKVELTITGNVRQWRHFMKLRTSKHAQADIKYLTQLIYMEMERNDIPTYLFEDVVIA